MLKFWPTDGGAVLVDGGKLGMAGGSKSLRKKPNGLINSCNDISSTFHRMFIHVYSRKKFQGISRVYKSVYSFHYLS